MTLTINPLFCRLITSFSHFFNSMSYVCVALICLKLLQITKRTKDNWGMFLLTSIGFLASSVTTIIWSMMIKIYLNKLCWIFDINSQFHWICHGTQISFLFLALILFICCIIERAEKYDSEIL